MVKVKENLTGKTFTRLTVIKQVEDYIKPNGTHVAQWLCACSCGDNNLIVVSGDSLKSGRTKSCGCLRLEKTIARSIGNTYGSLTKKYNKYDLSGAFGVGYTEKNEEFYFDIEDYDKIKHYCWHLDKDGYVVSNYNNTTIKMHRIIMNCKTDDIVDHKKHQNNDNRKSELRICTHAENSYNKKTPINNKSGYAGVWWDNERKKWQAYIKINKKKIYLGRFDQLNDAVRARKKAEEKHFGEFSYDNSMKESEYNELQQSS